MQCKTQFRLCSHSLADPYLTIREGVEGGGGGGHPDPEIRGGGRPFGSQFGLKIRGGPGPPGPSPRSATYTLPDRFCAGTIESPVG